jgi:hypothetical protein
MDRNRYRLIGSGREDLTDEEFLSGWHFCWDWDLMLIGPGMPEMESCACKPPAPPTSEQE